MAYANFNAHKFTYLNTTSIGVDYVHKDRECGFACLNTPSCFSFNLAAISDNNNGEILCELLPSDLYNNSDKLVDNKLFHHYSISVRQNVNIPELQLILLDSYTFLWCLLICFCLFFFFSFGFFLLTWSLRMRLLNFYLICQKYNRWLCREHLLQVTNLMLLIIIKSTRRVRQIHLGSEHACYDI